MCKRTEEEINELLKDLSEEPTGLIQMIMPGDFHGVHEFQVKKGRMLSFLVFDSQNCHIFHTNFSPHTIVKWHTHGKYSSEIIVVLSGKLSVIFDDGEEKILEESNILVIGKNIKHMAVISDKPTEILAMTIPKETDD